MYSTKSGTTDSTKKIVSYFMPFGTYNKLLIPVLPQIIEMRDFSHGSLTSEFQARRLDLRLSSNDENIQKEPVFVPC
jgi:hypothetical protein